MCGAELRVRGAGYTERRSFGAPSLLHAFSCHIELLVLVYTRHNSTLMLSAKSSDDSVKQSPLPHVVLVMSITPSDDRWKQPSCCFSRNVDHVYPRVCCVELLLAAACYAKRLSLGAALVVLLTASIMPARACACRILLPWRRSY